MGKNIYGEWLVPIVDYFTTLKKQEVYYEWLIPFISSVVICVCFFFWGDALRPLIKLRDVLPSTLAILIGFTITCITVLLSSSNNNIERLKEEETDNRIISKKIINIYQWVLIIFVYLLIVQIFLLIFTFFVAFILSFVKVKFLTLLFLLIKTFLLTHILLVLIRNITNFYFIFFKNI